jgi:hypothetical protein
MAKRVAHRVLNPWTKEDVRELKMHSRARTPVVLSTFVKSAAAFSSSPGLPTNRRQPIGREGDEIGDRQPSRLVFDIRIEAAVFMYNQDRGYRGTKARDGQTVYHSCCGYSLV